MLQQLLVDGHNRYRTCTKLKVEFRTRKLDIEQREDVINWIIANQLGRRNLSDEQKAYLRGKRYIAEKARPGADAGNSHATKNKVAKDATLKTSEKLAAEYGVSPRTIRNDAEFAAGVDAIERTEGPEAKAKILSGKSKKKKKDVIAAARRRQRRNVSSGSRPAGR